MVYRHGIYIYIYFFFVFIYINGICEVQNNAPGRQNALPEQKVAIVTYMHLHTQSARSTQITRVRAPTRPGGHDANLPTHLV